MDPNTVSTLLFYAIIGTLLIIFSPIHKMAKNQNGKLQSEIDQQITQDLEDNFGATMKKGCKSGLVLFVVFIINLYFTFIIEPKVVITAIMQEIGDPNIAYAMGVIIIIGWIYLVVSISKAIKEAKADKDNEVTITDEDGNETTVSVKGKEKLINHGNPAWRNIQRAFFALPTLYIWYVLYQVLFN